MKQFKTDLFVSFIIFIISAFFVFDLFLVPASLASFDAPFHITNMAQFYLALKDGNFPVVWTGSTANYGLPFGIVAHQLTSYLGALFIFITSSPLFAFKLVAFLGIFFSSLSYYYFSRIYFKPIASFAAAFLYTFTSYKIINFYIRGALPEIFAATFLPLVLIGIYLFLKKGKFYGLFVVALSFFLLSLNHPMMLLIYSFIYFPYILFLTFTGKREIRIELREKIKNFILLSIAILIGVGMASYYLVPLNLEIKYFYYGQIKNALTPNSFLRVTDLFRFDWKYFTSSEVFTRGHIIFPGILEILSVILGLGLIIYKWLKQKNRNLSILEFCVLVSLLILLFVSPLTTFLYQKINLLANMQFQWRMLSAFIFLPPLIYAYLFEKLNKSFLVLSFILLVCLLEFPQLYGKNYVFLPNEAYYFSIYNPHSVLMNSIWTGKTEDYPVKGNDRPQIIAGTGKILSKNIHNSSRTYMVDASTPLTMVDYTFYFPGWRVYVDGVPTLIEFQNPDYRGVITYRVPQGNHSIQLKFEDTRVRLLGKILSLLFASAFLITFVFRKKLSAFLKFKNEISN